MERRLLAKRYKSPAALTNILQERGMEMSDVNKAQHINHKKIKVMRIKKNLIQLVESNYTHFKQIKKGFFAEALGQ